MATKGFVYIATGKSFIAEAGRSAASLRQHMPGARTCCFTDDLESARPFFDEVRLIEKPWRNFFEKIPPLALSPFERSIFVDTDTLFTSSMEEVFDLLERFELAVVTDPFWCELPDMPACFAHMNTGLIAYQNTPRVQEFFRRWFDDFMQEYQATQDKSRCHDQGGFQRMLYASDLRFYILPEEYNLRVVCPQMVRLWAKPKMLHGRHPDLADLGRRLQDIGSARIIWPNIVHLLRSQPRLIHSGHDRQLQRLMRVLRFVWAKLLRRPV